MIEKLVTILYLSGDTLPLSIIAKILDTTTEEIEKNLDELDSSLRSIGLALLRSTDGLSIVTQPNQAQLVESFWKEELSGELTPASLQVLTLVAYLGNPTREEISYIRGIQSSQSVRALSVRGLISRNGENCALTNDALKQLGITKKEELPDYEKMHKDLIEKLETRNS